MQTGVHTLAKRSVRGERVRRLRDKRGWTQGQLSSYTDVAQSYISDI